MKALNTPCHEHYLNTNTFYDIFKASEN